METAFKKERDGKLTITEAGKQYQIPVDILQEYMTLGLAKNTKGMSGDLECEEKDLEILNLLILLHESGFEKDEVKVYVQAVAGGKKTVRKRIQMLNQKREEMLKEIHCKEGQLDRLDYLRYELQKQTT